MKRRRSFKLALLAAAALAAGGAHGAAPVAAVAPASVNSASDEIVVRKPGVPFRNVGVAAILAAGLAAFLGILDWERLKRLLTTVAGAASQTAKAAANASVSAIKAVGRLAASPLKTALLVVGLVLIAMLGVDLLDIEWAAGLATGILLVGLLWFGSIKIRRAVSSRIAKDGGRKPASGA